MADPALQTPEEQSDALAGKGLQTVMRRALPASAKQPLAEKTEPPVSIDSPEAYESLAHGKKFTDPEGNVRTKLWTVTDEDSYAGVPEGQQYKDPEGNVRTKPVYQNVDFTAQTLHGMATNDAERRKALERSYPGKVKQAPDGSFYVVEDDGMRRKPRGALSGTSVTENVLPAAVAGAAPTVGAVGGEIFGGLPGAGMGAVLGQGLNDLVLKWAGVYDRSFGEEAKELSTAGALSMAGGAIGRGAAAVIPSAVAGAAAGRAALPAMAATALGAEKETLQTALRIAEEGEHESSSRILKSFGMTDPGTPVPISSWAPHAPMLQLEQEVFHPRFFQEQPLKKGRTAFMEKQGKGLLDDIGAQTEGSLTEPESAVSGREAGQKAIDRAMQVSSEREIELRRLADEQRVAATTQAQEASVGHEARMATLREAGQQADVAATRVIDEGYKAIERDIENAMRTARAGHNSGDFWNSVAQKFRDLRGMIGLRASARYDGWRQTFGSVVPDAGGLAEEAKGFIEELPKSFQENRPALIKQLSKLAGSEGVEPVTLDLAEVHKLRSLFRHQIDWSDLPSDIRNGALKRFESQLNQVIHGADVPLAARKGLDDIDKWYGKVMPIWNDKRIQSVVDGIRNGKPADPKELVELMIKEGNTDLNNKLRRMLGPNLWSGIRGAHAENLIRKNKDLFGNVNGTGFARDVLSDSNSGLLRSIHGDEGAQRILRQAQHVSLLEGDMPIPVRQGDTALDVINRAREAQKAIEEEAKKNPLGLLKKELQRLNQYERQFLKDERARVGKDPFKFLIDKSFAAKEAAEKIASSEDLIIAYAARVGENSPEWEAMRQFIAKRIFTGTTDPADKLKVVSPEVSELVLGAKLQDARRLAKDMEFLKPRSSGAGSSIAATEKVTHPFGSGVVGKAAQAALKVVPGSGFGARTVLSEYYDLIAKLAQSPSTMRWVMKGLEGDPQSRQLVKDQIQRWMSRGGTIGAGVGEGARQLVEPAPENPQDGMQVPRLAEGGVVTQPTVAMIGEQGPEAVVPLDNPAAAQQAADVAAMRQRRAVMGHQGNTLGTMASQVAQPFTPNESVLPQEPSNMLADADPAMAAQQAREAAMMRHRQAAQPSGGRQEGEFTEGLLDLAVPGRGVVRSLGQGEYGEAALQAGTSAVPFAGKALGAAARAAPTITKTAGAAVAALTSMFMDPATGKSNLSPEAQEKLRFMQEKSKLEQKQRTEEAVRRKQEADEKAARDAQAAQQAAQTQADLQARLAQIEADKQKEQLRIEQERQESERRAAEETVKANAAENKRLAERPFRERHPDAALNLTLGGIAVAALIPGASEAYKKWAYNSYIREWEKLDKVAADALLKGTPAEQQLAVNRLSAAAAKKAEQEGKLHQFPWLTQLGSAGAAVEGGLIPSEVDITQPKESEAHKAATEFFSSPSEWGRLGALYAGGTLAGLTSKEAAGALIPTRKTPSGAEGAIKTYEQQAAARKKAESAAKSAKTRAAKKEKEEAEAKKKAEEPEKEPRKAKVPRGGPKIYGLREE